MTTMPIHCRYDFDLNQGEDGRLYITSKVLGDIPIPVDQQDAVRREATKFKDLYDQAWLALGAGEIEESTRLVDEMSARWGGDLVEIRALRWELVQPPCEE